MKKISLEKSAYIIFGALAICFALGSLAFATWQPPTATPPGNNAPAPINVSGTAQSKISGLLLNCGTDIICANPASAATNGLIVANGNVGIGTVTPSAKFTIVGINGATNMSAVNTITATAGNGGASSGIAGNGGGYSFTAGTGGTGGSGASTRTGGTGSSFNLNGGIGGWSGVTLAGAGGSITLTAGNGGSYNSPYANNGPGGTITLNAGHTNNPSATTYSPILMQTLGGNVGIGTTNPGTNKLEIVGGPTKTTGGLIIQTVANQTDENNMTKVAGQLWLRTDILP